MDKSLIISPFYLEAKNEIVRPTHFVATSQYFVDYWMPRLGPTGTCIVLFLRRRGYLNQTTGERRDRFVVSQKEIGEACQCSVATLRRQLADNQPLKAFVQVEARYERNDRGHVRQAENVYRIAMDDPLIPEDEPRLAELIQAREAARALQASGRKVIRRVPQPGSPELELLEAEGSPAGRLSEPSEPFLPAQIERVTRVVAQNERVGNAPVVAHFGTPPAQNERLLSVKTEILTDTHADNDRLGLFDTGEAETERVVVSLADQGISPVTARALVRECELEEIRRQIEMLPFREANDPPAVLVKAIRERWTPPRAFVQHCDERREEQRRIAERERLARERSAQDAVREERRARREALWAGLAPDVQAQIESEARERLRRENPFLHARLQDDKVGPAVRAALGAARDAVLAERFGVGE